MTRRGDSRAPTLSGVVRLMDVEPTPGRPGQPQLLLVGGSHDGPGGVLLLRAVVDPALLKPGTRYRLTLEPLDNMEVVT